MEVLEGMVEGGSGVWGIAYPPSLPLYQGAREKAQAELEGEAKHEKSSIESHISMKIRDAKWIRKVLR